MADTSSPSINHCVGHCLRQVRRRTSIAGSNLRFSKIALPGDRLVCDPPEVCPTLHDRSFGLVGSRPSYQPGRPGLRGMFGQSIGLPATARSLGAEGVLAARRGSREPRRGTSVWRRR